MNSDGEVIVPNEYTECKQVANDEGHFILTKDNVYYVFDREGKMIYSLPVYTQEGEGDWTWELWHDVFVQDGFAVLHRAHASTDAVADFLPVYAGLLVEKEVSNLEKAITKPERPLLLIIGGAKVEDKAPLIEKFVGIADKIVVGGKIAADGYVAKSDKIYVVEDFDEDGEGAKLDTGPV